MSKKQKNKPKILLIICIVILTIFIFFMGYILSYSVVDKAFDTNTNTNIVDEKKIIKLLVKEGETQEDIANTLQELGVVSYDEFMNACNNINFDYPFLDDMPKNPDRKSVLEGYLYPDTYFLNDYDSPEIIINKLLVRFDELYTQEMREKTKSMGLSIDNVVTIASMIEKEIKIPEEKSTAVSVIFNRLKQNMPLQLDATVIYANKKHKDRTLTKDTKIDSPYNTYKVKGLPIGPISNPSIQSINAVLNPANTDFLYYVLKNKNTGEHFYTNNYDEFLKEKNKYIKTLE